MSDELEDMLDEASVEALSNDPLLRKAFSIALLASDLYLPVYEDGATQAKAGGVTLQAISIDDTPHVLIFSSKDKLADFMTQDTRFARASGAQVMPSIRQGHAVLNPGPKGRAFTPKDFNQILGGNPKHGEPGHIHGLGCKHDQ